MLNSHCAKLEFAMGINVIAISLSISSGRSEFLSNYKCKLHAQHSDDIKDPCYFQNEPLYRTIRNL